jgi:ATP-binding protein involved in chromosome partitioning
VAQTFPSIPGRTVGDGSSRTGSTGGAVPARTNADVLDALRGVVDTELGDNIVELGMVSSVAVFPGGLVVVHIALTTPSCPLRGQIKAEVVGRVGVLPGVSDVRVETTEMGPEQKAALMSRARWKARERAPVTAVPPRARVLAISSGKGGVGKSSVAVNLAAGLAARGYVVGVLDADIAGFSVPRMLGIGGQLEAERDPLHPGRKLIHPLVRRVRPTAQVDGAGAPPVKQVGAEPSPPERPGRDGGGGELRVVSMGFLAGEGDAIMWRGLMLNRAVQHFLEEVDWGDLDYLIVDMPPGTGDIQMGLARMVPSAEVVIVTTPAQAAQRVAARAADMARKSHLRIAGVIENMSSFTCSHGDRYELFGQGGGRQLADELGVPLLASIPLAPAVAAGGDSGEPAAWHEGSAVAGTFSELVSAVLRVSPAVHMATCSARLLGSFDALAGRSI